MEDDSRSYWINQIALRAEVDPERLEKNCVEAAFGQFDRSFPLVEFMLGHNLFDLKRTQRLFLVTSYGLREISPGSVNVEPESVAISLRSRRVLCEEEACRTSRYALRLFRVMCKLGIDSATSVFDQIVSDCLGVYRVNHPKQAPNRITDLDLHDGQALYRLSSYEIPGRPSTVNHSKLEEYSLLTIGSLIAT